MLIWLIVHLYFSPVYYHLSLLSTEPVETNKEHCMQ